MPAATIYSRHQEEGVTKVVMLKNPPEYEFRVVNITFAKDNFVTVLSIFHSTPTVDSASPAKNK